MLRRLNTRTEEVKARGVWMLSLLALLLLTACSNIDCPIQTKVAVNYSVPDMLKDTLWVWTQRADEQDTLVLSRGVGLTSFSLPISYQSPVDTLVFLIADTNAVWTIDTVFVHKDDIPHFESVDCAAHFFHRLTAVDCTHRGIDSIVINHSSVDYDQTQTHLRIYFKSRR